MHDVFHLNDGAVHDHADGNGQPSQGHEVGRQPHLPHGNEGGQGHQGQGEGDDQRPPEAAEEQVNHQNHQEDALGDGPADGVDAVPDQAGAVIEGLERHPLGEDAAGVQLGDLFLDRGHHLPAAAAPDHQDDAGHVFPFAVLQHRAPAAGRTFAHGGHVLDQHRGAVHFFQHHRFDVLDGLHQAQASHQGLLAPFLQDVAAGIGIAGGQGAEDLLQAEIEFPQPVRVHLHLVLLDVAAEGVDVGDAGHGFQQRPDNGVLDGAQAYEAGGLLAG